MTAHMERWKKYIDECKTVKITFFIKLFFLLSKKKKKKSCRDSLAKTDYDYLRIKIIRFGEALLLRKM